MLGGGGRLIGVCVPAKLAALTLQLGCYLMWWVRSCGCKVHPSGRIWEGVWEMGELGGKGSLACWGDGCLAEPDW